MKRKRSLVLLIIVFFAFILFNSGCWTKKSASSSSSEKLFVIAKVVKGKVMYQLPSSKDWVILSVGKELKEKTKIKVFDDGFLVLEYPGKYKVSIAANTQMEIKELKPSKNKGFFSTIFSMIKGMIYSSVTINTKKGDGYAIETPQAVCGVYGTKFCTECDGKMTKLYVEEGKVDVYTPDSSHRKMARVMAGMKTKISNGICGTPKTFNLIKPPYQKFFSDYKIDMTIDQGDIKVKVKK